MTTDEIQLVPASQFSMEELTAIYNRTRVDYMVPMPMNVARLAEYVKVYDINLENSLVAAHDGEMLGVAMLGRSLGRPEWVVLGLAGCLIEARFDFPFQIHSILFLFLTFCAVLFSLSRRSGASRR